MTPTPKLLATLPFHHSYQGYAVVIGLNPNDNCVPLVRKTRPKWQAGRLNFPGGKIEPGESPIQAAAREMLEETGVELSVCELNPVARLTRPGDFELFVFCAITPKMADARTHTDEQVEKLPMSRVAELDEGEAVENVAWLWRLAFDGYGKFADIEYTC